MASIVPSSGERVVLTESLNRDLNGVSMCCDLRGIKFYVSKTNTMIVSRSGTIHTKSTPLTLDGTVLTESTDLVILGVT